LGHPYKFLFTGFASWQRYCTASSSGHQQKFAALNTGGHVCLTRRPSRWALAHILVYYTLCDITSNSLVGITATFRMSSCIKHGPRLVESGVKAKSIRTVQPVATCRHSHHHAKPAAVCRPFRGGQSRDAPIGLLRLTSTRYVIMDTCACVNTRTSTAQRLLLAR